MSERDETTTPEMAPADARLMREVEQWLLRRDEQPQWYILENAADGSLSAAIREAAANGCALGLPDVHGVTPMHDACSRGWLNAAKSLQSLGAPISASTDIGITPIHMACHFLEIEVVQWLFPLVQESSVHGHTLLHFACLDMHATTLALVQWLHGAGLSVNAASDQGTTTLHVACGRSLDLLGGYGFSEPIYYREQYDERSTLDVVEFLLNEGASVNACTDDGSTPLHEACYRCDDLLSIIECLCTAGADTRARLTEDMGAKTPMQQLNGAEPGDRTTWDEVTLDRTKRGMGLLVQRARLQDAADEREAEERSQARAAELIAEEEAETRRVAAQGSTSVRSAQRPAKGKSKAHTRHRADAGQGSSSDAALAALQPSKADELIRSGIEHLELDALRRLINQVGDAASPSVLAEARTRREHLRTMEAKERKLQRKRDAAAEARAAREGQAVQALQSLINAQQIEELRAATQIADDLMDEFPEMLAEEAVAARGRLQVCEEELRASSKLRHVEEHAMRFEELSLEETEQLAAAEKAPTLCEAEACVICMDELKTHILIPCGHQCVCATCSDRLAESSSRNCPVCRREVDLAVQVFK